MPDRRQLIAKNGQTRLATEALGDPADPPVLLVMGAMGSMLWWPDPFVNEVASAGRYVMRFDHRDTGLSTAVPPGKGDYSLEDMASDAVAVLDAHSVKAAQLVGLSIGGAIAQQVALSYPDRVSSLTLIDTTPLGVDGLPPPSDQVMAQNQKGASIDWSSREDVIQFFVDFNRAQSSPDRVFDDKRLRALVERDYDRATSFVSATNHGRIAASLGEQTADLASIAVPVTVLHGTKDPLYPIKHGEALANAIPGSVLERVEGGGHELNPADWPQVVRAIVETGKKGT